MLPASVYLGWVLAGLGAFFLCRAYGPPKNRVVISLIGTVVLSWTLKIVFPDGLIGVNVSAPILASEPPPPAEAEILVTDPHVLAALEIRERINAEVRQYTETERARRAGL